MIKSPFDRSIKFKVSLFFLLCIFITSAVSAQDKIKKHRPLGAPEAFENIIDDNLYRTNYKQVLDNTRDKSDTPWIVMCDRTGIQTREKPGEGTVLHELKFKEGPFYVVDEKGDYVEIVKGRKVKSKVVGESYGWVNKKEMLLWMNAVYTENRIPKYVFILYKVDAAEEIFTNESERAAIFYHPDAEEKGESVKIFKFYAVLKQEGDRYLLATDASLTRNPSQRQLNQRVLGWAKVANCTEWSTRIALEPNFTEEAFQVRKKSKDFQVVGFDTPSKAAEHAKSGKPDMSSSAWSNDPAGLDDSKLSTNGSHRFPGSVMRSPMLSGVRAGASYFRGGIIGDVMLEDGTKNADDGGINQVAEVCDFMNLQADAMNNVNVLFIVQGTSNMAPLKEEIKMGVKEVGQSFAGMKANLRFGAVVYRNVSAGDNGGEVLSIHEMSNSEDELIQFLDKTSFDNFNNDDNSNFPAVAYAIEQGLNRARLNQEYTNLIFIIGEDGDFQYNSAVRNKYKNDRAAVTSQKIIDKLTEVNAHIYAIGVSNRSRSNSNFLSMSQKVIAQSAIKNYNKRLKDFPRDYTEATGLVAKIPFMPPVPDEAAENTEIVIETSSIPAVVYLPKSGTTNMSVSKMIRNGADRSQVRLASFQKAIDSYCRKGNSWKGISKEMQDYNSISPGGFDNLIIEILNGVFKDKEISPKYLGKRYQLYNEVFFAREVNGMDEATMKYVLFIKDSDVVVYVGTIERILRNTGGSSDEQREAIVKIYGELLSHFTGNEQLRTDSDTYTIQEMNMMIYGIQGEGLDCPDKMKKYELCNIDLPSILDPRGASDEKIQKLIENFEQVADVLRNTVLAADYKFKFVSHSNDVYYWIDTELLY